MGDLLSVLQSRKKISAATEGAFAPDDDTRLFPTNAYAGRGGSFFQHIYETETNAEPAAGGRFRWILSTCLAATIGAIAILIVVYGSSDDGDRTERRPAPSPEKPRRGSARPSNRAHT